MSGLRKADVERLLADYDENPVAALTVALRIVLDQPSAEWPELLTFAPLDQPERDALAAGEVGALDALARELNELRGLRRV